MRKTDFGPSVAWSLLNDPASATLATADGNGDVSITGLPKFNVKQLIGRAKTVPVTEVAQVGRVFVNSSLTASKRFAFKFGGTSKDEFGYDGALKVVGHTLPATLIANNADGANIIMSWKKKVNLDTKRNYVTADACIAISVTPVTNPLLINHVVTGNTSGATAIVLSTSVAAGSAGFVLLKMTSEVFFTSAETATVTAGTGSATVPAANMALTAFNTTTNPALGTTSTADATAVVSFLRLTDTGGYQNASSTKRGPTVIVPHSNLSYSDLRIQTDGVVSEGQGADLLARVPVLERTSGNLRSGQFNMALNEAPVSGSTYTRYDLKIKRSVNDSISRLAVGNSDSITSYTLWLKVGATHTAAIVAVIDAYTIY